jgi:DNA-binding CsgD family transcriptional regulator
LLTRAGLIDSARREFEKLPAIVGDASDLERWPTTAERHEALAAAARLSNRSGDPERAFVLARSLVSSADAEGAGLELLSGRVHAIEALHALDRPDDALEHLKEAIAFAVPQKATQFMRDGDVAVARSLRALILRSGLSAFRPEAAAFLASALGPLRPKRMGELSNSSAVILTKREAEALEWLARGESNKRIAAELDLTEAAVKFHLKNLFRKLGVNRRALASNVARQIGLV